MVARDPLNRGAAFINPLELVTDQEKDIFAKGEMNKKRYKVFQIHYINLVKNCKYILNILFLFVGDIRYLRRHFLSKYQILKNRNLSMTSS